MFVAITHHGDADNAISAASAGIGIQPDVGRDLMMPSDRLAGIDRLEIYRTAYQLRLHEALESDFPALADYLGPRRFGDLVRGYVRAHPSTSYTLNRLGDHLPEYLRTIRGKGAGGAYDLARLELLTTTLFDADHAEVLRPADLDDVPVDAWAGARLLPVPGFGMLKLRYGATRYWSAVRAGEPRPALRRTNVNAVVYRNVYSVRHVELEPAAFRVLGAIVDGRPLGEALSLARRRLTGPDTAGAVFTWFNDWVARGFFASIVY